MDGRFDRFMSMPLDGLDFQLSPSKSAKDAAGALAGMVAATSNARTNPDIQLIAELPYGLRPRQTLDVYLPRLAPPQPLPCLIFLHGGFWQEGAKSVSGFAAETFARLGWATVAVGYTLTPDVTLAALTGEINEAVLFVAERAVDWGIDPARLVLAGHSAGGHLAASVVCDLTGTGAHQLICGALLISGVFELAPIARSYVNDLTRMTAEDIGALSPLRHMPAGTAPLHVLIGADEPEAFQVQSRALCEVWGRRLQISFQSADGKDHFDVLDVLNDPASPTISALSRMVQKTR